MTNCLHSIRVAYENWVDLSRFTALLGMLQKYDTGIGTISLFTSAVHTPLTLAEMARRAEILKERIELAKSRGFSCGINVLATIGHHHEDLGNTPAWQYRTMVNANGEECRGTVCMNDERYIREYVEPIYRMLASVAPDHIWVDDDIRYGHMPIGNGCFCPLCIDRFNRANGFSYTRETLCAALEEDNIPLRLAWLRFRSDTICRLLRSIGNAVRTVDDRILLGFMTGERYAEGYDFAGYADALSDHGKYPIQWRPGGGAYTDRVFDEIVQKAEQIGRQNAFLPPYVAIRQAEIENFPYNMIKKTPRSTAAEAFLGIMSGCTGAAFNILPSETGEVIYNAEKHLKAIAQYHALSALLAKQTEGAVPIGIHTGWKPIDQAALPFGAFDRGYGGSYAEYNRELFSLGLPECWRMDEASVCTLTGRSVSVMTDAEIREMLSGGVYMDIHALRELHTRGFGTYTGFSVGDVVPVDAREQYTDDECGINKGIVGGIRNGRQAFNVGDSYGILPQSESCKILSTLVDYHDKSLASCTLGLYENTLGGRICVAGYYPYSWISDFRKTVQLKRIFNWLSGNTLPIYVDSYHMLRCSVWKKNEKLHCAAVFNPTNGTAEHVCLHIHETNRDVALLYDIDCRSVPLPCHVLQEENASHITIPSIAPYTGVVLLF